MISKKMAEAINEQVNRELYSAYLYQAMSSHFAREGYKGFASWLSAQSREEAGHAFKFYQHLVDRGAQAVWKAIDAPPASFKSPLDVFEAVLTHEQFVTRSIHGIVDLAVQEKDYATQNLLQWFVTEQVEEEGTAEEILSKIRRLGSDERGLYLLDKELGFRKAD